MQGLLSQAEMVGQIFAVFNKQAIEVEALGPNNSANYLSQVAGISLTPAAF